ncbi:MAG TPA: glycoside hydrolase family 9 protein [Polyangiaceae bacterium]|nr:glycoside hydrolase family 9 protein [Polyangiaceae bacterium]
MGRSTKLGITLRVASFASSWALAAAAQSTPVELIADGDFGPEQTAWGADAPIVDGRYCIDVPGGTINPWDVAVSQAGVPIVNGETYELSFDASSAPRSVTVRALVQVPSAPFATALDRNPVLGAALQHYSYTFQASQDLTAAVSLQVGGASEPWTFCLDNLSLKSGATLVPYAPDTGPRVRVNQVGYLPSGPKRATLVTAADAALPWRLRDENGAVVARGRTEPFGIDATSGLNVHVIRFDRVHASGRGLRLEADGELSHAFDIDGDVYQSLRADAFAFFYAQRSGIAIDGNLLGAEYARAAGHVGVAPNQGDVAVPCMPAARSQTAYGEPWTCDYTLDVSGGWYDAGDHGKYVVNGGISTAQLLSTYERALHARGASRRALGDGSLAIPEQGNGVPDVLDEARWELEFLLSMQVPSGQPLAGMVHHKIHDNAWSALPLDPALDPLPRELHRPSTAATLNLAAAAAQGARLYRRYDAAFAEQLLGAARLAWDAALANPALYAPGSDGTGGGSYSDADVSDEFYWAAAELYLTTHEAPYLDAVLASPHHTGPVFELNGFSWARVAALGRLDLASVPSPLPGARDVRRSVLDAADALLALVDAQAWGQPYAPTGNWVWGSTSQLLNNLVVLGTAYDVSGDARYRRAVLEGADFLLGRNALNLSFITGYGDVFSQNQHSRIFGAQLNGELPHPPIGSIAGGPNSGLQDPVARQLLTGCIGQFCYVDDINSYSTNEIAINWNAPLAWVASFLADQGSCR